METRQGCRHPLGILSSCLEHIEIPLGDRFGSSAHQWKQLARDTALMTAPRHGARGLNKTPSGLAPWDLMGAKKFTNK